MRAERPAPGDGKAARAAREYWDGLAEAYQDETVISCSQVHYGPLVPGERRLRLLPPDLDGRRCLEVGCGAAQNAICLARRGARCTAVDLSGAQLQAARRLAQKHHVAIDLVQADMQALPLAPTPLFDLVLSAYALPFVAAPQDCIAAMAARLRPGGTLILSTAHPLSTSEWIDVDGQAGIFLRDYFHPPADQRRRGAGRSRCRPVPVSTVFAWLRAAGLQVDALLEPPAEPVRRYTLGQLCHRVPYWSRAWLALAEELARVPVVAIVRARKP